MPLSRAQPMRPMVITATAMMRARRRRAAALELVPHELAEPRVLGQHLRCAISTIQATPRREPQPGEDHGQAPGSTMRRTLGQQRRGAAPGLTLCRSLSNPATRLRC